MATPGPLVRILSVQPLDNYRVLASFSNGTSREIDLEPYLHGPIFEPIRKDPDTFRAMRIEGNTISWENGADIDPDVLFYNLKPAWMEEIEPTEA